MNYTAIINGFKRETEKAILLEGTVDGLNVSSRADVDTIDMWFPKSQLTITPLKDGMMSIVIPAWLARQNRLGVKVEISSRQQ